MSGRRRAAAVAVGLAAAASLACGADDSVPLTREQPTTVPTTTAPPTTAAAMPATAPPTTTTAPAPPPSPDQLAGVSVRIQEIARVAEPTAMAVRPGFPGFYVAEREGRVRAVVDGALRDQPVVDLSSEVGVRGEGGLLGLAFSPAGDRLYLHYTNTSADTRIVELTMSGEVADRASLRELLAVEQPAVVHNGGQIAVDGQGLLWIALGDGGDRGSGREEAQRLTSLLGKLIRIDPRPGPAGPYTVPADNPFVGRADARPEIWALGLRNPWRFSFDMATGDLWVADVGEFKVEEVNLAPAPDLGRAANYGWPRYEGPQRFTGDPLDQHELPVHTYPHADGRCAVTGGYVYRGSEIPGLAGAYVFGDVCEGHLRAISVVDGRVVAERVLVGLVGQFASLGQDAAGELYALSLGGPIFRVLPG